MGIIAVVVMIGGGLGAFLWMQKQKPKESAIVPTAVAPTLKPALAPVPKSAVTPAPKPADTANKSPAPEKPAVPAQTIDDFSVSKITLEKMQGSSLVYAVGTAKNTVDRQRFGVRIELNLLDEQDKNIGVVSDYVSVVEPHKDWQFKALLMPTQTAATKVKVAEIKEQK